MLEPRQRKGARDVPVRSTDPRACVRARRGRPVVVRRADRVGPTPRRPRPTSESPTTPSAGTTTPSASASATAASFPIPNGTYDATADPQRGARQVGFSNKEIDKWYGPDGKLPVTLVLADGRYKIFVVGDDGVKELGATATYTATKKLWVAADESEGCPGCIYTYRWSSRRQGALVETRAEANARQTWT